MSGEAIQIGRRKNLGGRLRQSSGGPTIARLAPLTVAAFLFAASLVRAAEPLALYVATDGNDAWSGALPHANAAKTDGPFASIERARGEVRKRKAAAAHGVEVFVRSGEYLVPDTVTFSAADSGTDKAPIVYRAYQKERPLLIGGRRISAWQPWKGNIVQADVSKQGFKNARFEMLVFNGKRQHLARYPNFDPDNPYGGGWAYADGKLIPMYQNVPGESKRSLQVRSGDLRTWQRPEEVEVFVFPRYNWWNNVVRIASFDRSSRQITLAADCSYPVRPGDRYYFQNALEELDAPGEWYLDSQAGKLYFWPPTPLAGKPVYAPTTGAVLQLDKAAHVTFRGFTIECASGAGALVNGCEHCLIAGCTIRNVGGYHGSGVAINGGMHNGVAGCDLYDIGANGIGIDGGDRKTLTPAGNYADNNYIHHTGVIYKQGVGISLRGVGNRASHNLIHDGPRMGIMFSGNNLVIEYNHIRHVNLETEDTGAVYTGGRDWISSRGTVIRHNYFHDILGYGKDHQGHWVSPHFAWGVYLDDNAGGVDVIGNIVARCSRAGLHLHNGRDNVIENNVFIENGLQQFEYSGWRFGDTRWNSHFDTMEKGYALTVGQPAWSKMRHMDLPPAKAALPDGTVMAGNVFERNIVAWRNPAAKLLAMRNVSFEHNPIDHNVYFHFGQPMETGVNLYGRALSKNLAPNPGFERGKLHAMPQDWQWQIHPLPSAKAESTAAKPASGKRALQIDAAFNADKPRDNYPIVVSRELELKLGAAYRLSAKLRATQPDATAKLMLQSYVAKAYFWASSPQNVSPGLDWTPAEFTFRLPSPGGKGYHPQMKTFRVRVDFPDKSGSLFVDDVELQEVESLDGWQSWQRLGNDKHSVVADPQFVDFDRDDFRLKETSPAFGLGFKPIPVDRIGPYEDELRASWPIVEAEGAREKPLVTSPGRATAN